MNLLRGVIEDNNSPLKDGRVRVRVLGVHTEDISQVKTEELPWSEIMGGLGNAGSGLGLSQIPEIGTWVFVVPDHDDFNRFIVVGTLGGMSIQKADTTKGFNDPSGKIPLEDRLNEYDVNRLTRVENLEKTIHNDINNSDLSCAGNNIPKSTSDASKYPDNVVYEDKSGNIIEVDSTEGNERFRLYHSKSKTRIEIDKDGNIIASTSKNIWNKLAGLFSLDASQNITIKGDIKIDGSIECTGNVSASGNIVSSSEITDSKGNLSSLRDAYDGHNHLYNPGPGAPTPTAIPTTTDPLSRTSEFKWSGSPL